MPYGVYGLEQQACGLYVPVAANPSLATGVVMQASQLANQTNGHMAGQMAAHVAQPTTRPWGGQLFQQLARQPGAPPLSQARILQSALRHWSPDNQKRMYGVMRQFEAAMATEYFGSEYCWDFAEPEHVYKYVNTWAYTGGDTQGGRKAHSTVSKHVSMLSQLFRMRGRDARWNSQTRMGNPCDSYHVEWLVSGFGKENVDEGAVTVGAVPWGFETLCPMLSCMDDERLTRPKSMLLLKRDAAAFVLAALTGKRGSDVGFLRVSDITTASDCPVDPRAFKPTEGEGYVLTMYSKTRKIYPGPPLCFTYTAVPGKKECNFIWRLEQYWGALAQSHKYGLFAFGDKDGKPLTCDCLNKRLEVYFPKYGLGEPLKMHGLRRGLIQSLEAAGFAKSEIMEHLDIRSNRAYELYRDQYRHLAPDHPERLAAMQYRAHRVGVSNS